MTTSWYDRYANRVRRERNSAIADILRLTQRPEIISFAGGLPAAEFFPTERVLEATRRVLEGPQRRQALQYGVSAGYMPLRNLIAERLRAAGAACTAENVLITTGSQQALDLIGKVLIDPGDRIAVEEPTYMGMMDAWNMYGAAYTTVATDECGMIPAALEQTLQRTSVKLIYLVPNFQNPTGVTIPASRREELVRIARRYGVPIVEDDPYGMLRYEGTPIPTLFASDTQLHVDNNQGNDSGAGNVIYLGTFSKTLCPGFRVAWLVAPVEVICELAQAKQDGDLHTSTFAQAVACETACDGFLDEHIKTLCVTYDQRRRHMLALMDDCFPPSTTWTRPEGGLFVWVRLPEGVDTTVLLKEAVEQGVAYVPGSPFFPRGGGENTLRMNFSNSGLEQIEEGIRRLATVFERACREVVA